MARTYKRDSRGRFASGGGGSGGRPAAKAAPRGANRLTRDNAGRITSVGGDGATARGGRLRTASGKQRAVQTARIKGGGGRLRGGKGQVKVAAKPAKKLEFNQSDFQRRSQRTAGIRNPQVRQKAQSLYGKILNLDSTPRQLRSMFKKAGKPKSGGRTAAQRRSEREHRDMLALANRLFR